MPTTESPAAPITLTIAQATQAFDDWETEYRANPDQFLTHEESAAMEVATISEQRAIYLLALLRQRTATIPLPGQPWPEQGGIYIGIAPAEGGLPMRHVVALDATPPAETMTWRKGMDWAASLGNGTNLPTQIEAIMACNVARQAFPGNWYWTSTQASRSDAFVQDFESGYSVWTSKDVQHRVRAFRGLALDTFTPLTLEGGAK